jgi:hypothetical protein
MSIGKMLKRSCCDRCENLASLTIERSDVEFSDRLTFCKDCLSEFIDDFKRRGYEFKMTHNDALSFKSDKFEPTLNFKSDKYQAIFSIVERLDKF